MPSDNRLDRLAQGNWLRLASWPALVHQRFQNRLLFIIQNDRSALISHSRWIGTVLATKNTGNEV
jgi:hypothetical protein